MPRSGGGIYSLPAGSTVANGDTAVADDLNVPLADLEADANTVRPVVAGGTGAATAADARTNLGLVIGTHVQAYDADLTSWAGVTRASGFDTFAATPSSANLRALLTDEVGTGAAYFVGGALGTPASGTLTNCTGLTTSGIAAATLVTESEGIASNDNDTTIPTSAAVKDYVDNAAPSAPSTAQVLSATAGLTAGDVGTYAILARTTLNTAITFNSTISGASLRYAGFNDNLSSTDTRGSNLTGANPSGTWRALGHCDAAPGYASATLFVRTV